MGRPRGGKARGEGRGEGRGKSGGKNNGKGGDKGRNKGGGKAGTPQFAKENAATRISRDVFVYDPSTLHFLATPWGSAEHRSTLQYGNAFGAFLCRPPKDAGDLERQLRYATKMEVDGQGVVLRYDVSGGVVGHKTADLNAALPTPFRYEDAAFECVVLPSRDESPTSSIGASMTVLAYFLPVAKAKVRGVSEGGPYVWLDAKQAVDPSTNVHASVVQAFLYRKRVANLMLFRGANVASIQKKLAAA